MPTALSEMMNGGIVTLRHPALLSPGELQRADDCVYRENDPAIWRAPGRTQWGTVIAPLSVAGCSCSTGAITAITAPAAGSFAGVVVGMGVTVTGGGDTVTLPAGTTVATVTLTDGAIASITLSNAFGGTTDTSTTLTFTSPVFGLSYLSFQQSRFPAQILALAGSTLWIAPTATDNGAVTSTELGQPGTIVGDCTSVGTPTAQTIFTANAGSPFLASIVGAVVTSSALDATPGTTVVVADVSGSAVNGRYSAVMLKKLNGDPVTSIFGTTSDLAVSFNFGVQTILNMNTNIASDALQAVQYGQSYFCWHGSDGIRKLQIISPNLVVGGGQTKSSVLRQRPIGMSPVTEKPTLEAVSGTIAGGTDSYAWRTALGTGYFWFLITEISVQQELKDGVFKDVPGSEVESIYLGQTDGSNVKGQPLAVQVPNLQTGVKITMPAVVNRGSDGRLATHWGIYMSSNAKDTGLTPPSLATFIRIRREAITKLASGAIIYIYETNNKQTLYCSGTAAYGSANQWTNISAVQGAPTALSGGLYLAGSACARGDSNNDSALPDANQPANKLTFSIDSSGSWASRLITGVAIRIWGRADSSTTHRIGHVEGVYVFPMNSAGEGAIRFCQFDNSAISTQHRDFGGSGDTWGVSFGTFTAGASSFAVVLGLAYNDAGMTAWIDACQVTIWGDSQTIDLNGKAYRVVVYRDQIGNQLVEPAYNVHPGNVSTGDFFEGCLCVNDSTDESALRFSLPGDPEYFPSPYVMRLDASERQDKITFIKNIGTCLIVGLENSIERVNYLPREDVTALNDGLSHEPLHADHGIAGPLAGIKFDMPGEGLLLAYANNSGVFLTNGIWARPINVDLDWKNTVKISALPYCHWRVYPKEKWLVLYYTPFGATHNRCTRALVFHYAADKIKQGGYLPATGPMVVSARSSCLAVVDGAFRLLTGHETSGLVYNEDTGTTIPTGYRAHITSSDSSLGDGKSTASTDVTINPIILTRRLYASGIERDVREERILLLFSSYGAAITASSTTVLNSVTVTSSAAFGSVLPGMRVVGTGIDAGTIVIAKASSSSITLSRAANASGTATLAFDTGTVAVTIRGCGIGEAVTTMDTSYISTLVGELVTAHNDNTRKAIELQIEKVVLPDTTSVDLGVNMRLHQCTLLLDDQGLESNRSVA